MTDEEILAWADDIERKALLLRETVRKRRDAAALLAEAGASPAEADRVRTALTARLDAAATKDVSADATLARLAEDAEQRSKETRK